MIDVSTFCICNHVVEEHEYYFLAADTNPCLYKWCGCKDFKQDNLKYLEQLYDQKGINND
jgi:hypothetical protein